MDLPSTESSDPSVVFITMHKAGSTFASHMLSKLLKSVGMPHVNITANAFRNGLDPAAEALAHTHLFKTPGYFFGAFRGPWVGKFPRDSMTDNRIIVQVRDPRDCIVSLYFSMAFSHPEPGGDAEAFKKARELTASREIDEHARAQVKQFSHRMQVIRDVIDRHDNVLLLEYAEMVENFSGWLDRLVRYLGEGIRPNLVEWLKDKTNFKVEEDPNRHMRQVTPGDFRRKLRPDTQAFITEQLKDHLNYFGYDTGTGGTASSGAASGHA